MNQKRTIIGSCDYSIATLENIKRELVSFDNATNEITWAVGGIICSLTSQLLQACNAVFVEAARSGEANAREDLLEIQRRFNDFVNRMVEHE